MKYGGGIHMIPLWKVLELAGPWDLDGEGPSLKEAVEFLMDLPHDREVILDLMAEWKQHGRFSNPIWVSNSTLLNGCHRLSALVHLGVETVECFVVTDRFPKPWYRGEFTTVIVRKFTDSVDEAHQLINDMPQIGRSFRGSGMWLESDLAKVWAREGYVLIQYDFLSPMDHVFRSLGTFSSLFARHNMEVDIYKVFPAWDPDTEEELVQWWLP
jgi:hypothetical protein